MAVGESIHFLSGLCPVIRVNILTNSERIFAKNLYLLIATTISFSQNPQMGSVHKLE